MAICLVYLAAPRIARLVDITRPTGAAISTQPLFVHVGLPKTGTTHLQATLAANRRRLAAQGLFYPRSKTDPQHFRAVLDFLQVGFGAIRPSDVEGSWRQLVTSVTDRTGSALVSHELLAGAGADDVARLVDDFSSKDVHVIVTVRDLSRLLPAVWQERAKNGVVESWSQFRAGVARGPGADPSHAFWRLHNVDTVVAVWRQHLPDDHIHVLTVPPSGADESLLFGRLAAVLGIDRTGFVVPDAAANASIGALELAVLRQVNVVADQRLDRAKHQAMVKRHLVPRVLARREGQLKVTLSETDRAWVEAYTDDVRKMLSAGRLDVVGDVADLTPTNFAPDDAADPAQSGEFPDAVVASALAEVVVDLLAERAVEQATRPATTGRGLAAARAASRDDNDSDGQVDVPVSAPLVRRVLGAGRRLLSWLRH